MVLIRHYPLQEDSGDVLDASGNGSNGTVTSLTQGATGILGTTAYDLDGSTSYFDMEHITAVQETNNFTISFWMNADDTGSTTQAIIFQHIDLSNRVVIGMNNGASGQLQTAIYDGSSFVMDDYFDFTDTANWHHVVLVWDSSTDTGTFYLDGAQSTQSGNNAAVSGSATTRFTVGRNEPNDADYYDGKLAALRVYDHTLTPSEVQYLHDVGTTGTILTATKTHGSSVQPDLRADVTLNGESATAYVIGSPETASEEVIAQSLSDGNNDYTLSWSNNHADFRVQVQADLSTSVNRVEVNKMALLV